MQSLNASGGWVAPDPASVHVAVVAGGASHERSVSLMSGEQVHTALTAAGYPNEVIDTGDVPAAFARLLDGSFDVVFVALHGRGGEDGAIQGICETMGIPYTGSGILACALSLDKSRSKTLYRQFGIPTAPWVTLYRSQPYDVGSIVAAVGEQCVGKPVNDGSSIGMSIVHTAEELPAALEVAFATGDDVLVESFVGGMEITVGVVGGEELTALPVIEIVPHDEFYTYDVKYREGGSEHIIPARLPYDVYLQAQEYAKTAHRALGCRGMSRSDFIVNPRTGPVILETNAVPGMTATSLLPDAARHMGIEFPELCSMLVRYALEPRP